MVTKMTDPFPSPEEDEQLARLDGRCGEQTVANGEGYVCTRHVGHTGDHRDNRRTIRGDWSGITWPQVPLR